MASKAAITTIAAIAMSFGALANETVILEEAEALGFIFGVVIFVILINLLIGVYANQRRGRSGLAWFIVSCFIGPIFSLLFLLVLKKRERLAHSEP